jgi:uncharacterized membrane protein
MMAIMIRIFGWSLLASGLGGMLGFVLFGKYHDWTGVALLLACVGAIVGAIAAGAGEIAIAGRR